MSFRNRFRGALASGFAALLSLTLLAAAEPPKPRSAVDEKLDEAQSLFDEGNYKEAVKVLKEAAKLANGPCIGCHLALARTFNKMGAYRESLKHVDAILQASNERDDLISAYNEQGVALVALAGQDAKELAAAENAFRKVLELSGGKINAARFNLGFTLLRMSHDAEGIAILKEYLETDPKAESAETAKDLIANPLRARKRLIPNFELVTLAGEYLTAEDVKGKVLLLDFWGTWCPPCVASVPSLKNLSRRMEGQPFVLLSVSTDNDEATVRDFVAKEKMTWPQVWDKGHDFTRKCQIERFPTYLVVSHEGEIVYGVSGWGDSIERELSLRIATAVKAAKRKAKQAGG